MTTSVTNRDVNRALREVVWPALKRAGFTRRTGRTAWRDRPDQVDVVTFWSHNAYNAGVLNVNTVSFQLCIGTQPLCRMTPDSPQKDGLLRPPEPACDFRRMPVKPFVQEETNQQEVWFVRSDGENLQWIIEAARDWLLSEGELWFESLNGIDRMLDVARHQELTQETAGGMGNLGSPHRQELIADLEVASRR